MGAAMICPQTQFLIGQFTKQILIGQLRLYYFLLIQRAESFSQSELCKFPEYSNPNKENKCW